MATIKLVIVGASGVGKTSFRVKYISGRFSTGYRPTIGVDFITKTIPSPEEGGEPLVLQIWDTAGQERFSSLSTAFFRGADAVILMYDVNDRASLYKLTKWWADFCAHAPVRDEDRARFCVVVVGNKVDVGEEEERPVEEGGREALVDGRGQGGRVSREEAMRFLKDLVPLNDHDEDEHGGVSPSESQIHRSDDADSEHGTDGEMSSSQYTIMPRQPTASAHSQPKVKPTPALLSPTMTTKNRLLSFPNGLLSRVGLLSTTTAISSSSTAASSSTTATSSSTSRGLPSSTMALSSSTPTPSSSTPVPHTSTTNAVPNPNQNSEAVMSAKLTGKLPSSSQALHPSPSQVLLRGLATAKTTTPTQRSIQVASQRSIQVASQPAHRSHSASHSFYSSTFTSAHSGSASGFSIYHTPDASVGSFSDYNGVGGGDYMVGDYRIGAGAGSAGDRGGAGGGATNESDGTEIETEAETETETEGDGDGVWYDARMSGFGSANGSVWGSRSASVWGSRSVSRSRGSYADGSGQATGGMSKPVSRQASHSRLGNGSRDKGNATANANANANGKGDANQRNANGNGLGNENGNGLGNANTDGTQDDEPRRTSSLATLTNLTVHGEMTGSTASLGGILEATRTRTTKPKATTTASAQTSTTATATSSATATTSSARSSATSISLLTPILTTTTKTTNNPPRAHRYLRPLQPPLAISTAVSGSSTNTTDTTTTYSALSAASMSTSGTSVEGDCELTQGNESESSGSAITITPARMEILGGSVSSSVSSSSSSVDRVSATTRVSGSGMSSLPTPPVSQLSQSTPPPPSPISLSLLSHQPPNGPALFLTSAKRGDNVDAVFAYVARRVVEGWAGEDDLGEDMGGGGGLMDLGQRERERGGRMGGGRTRGRRKVSGNSVASSWTENGTAGGNVNGTAGGHVGRMVNRTVRLSGENEQDGRCAGVKCTM